MAAATPAVLCSMVSGPPLPLPSEFPLLQLIPLINHRTQAGAWVRGAGAAHRLAIIATGRCTPVLIGEDLGQLLHCCTHVVLRGADGPVAMAAEQLIHWRALQVVIATPHLPGPDLLDHIFPGAQLEPTGFSVPTASRSPEEVLSECVRQGIPVAQSRVVYRQHP
jgi:hypothetical protein